MGDDLFVGQAFEGAVEGAEEQVGADVVDWAAVSGAFAGAGQFIDAFAAGRGPVHRQVQAGDAGGAVVVAGADHAAAFDRFGVALFRPARVDRQHQPLNVLDQLPDRPPAGLVDQ
ncbi:hypothetical protein, partial [Microbispora sp. NPDC049125]|uniref:hypothetical protein n=1 Tax=Microbispora sp. NPDC049125 TaxID=3154929 RepID=UPI00346736B9